MGGVPEDVLCLSLGLCFGDIQAPLGEDCPRRDFLRRWYGDGREDTASRDWRETMADLGRLCSLGPEDHVRIWTDGLPDDLCGLLFAAEVLAGTKSHVSAVFLPSWQERPNGTLVQYQGWGEASYAPPEYADRETLWNAVEKAERGKNAQLAYSFDIALQNEFSIEENIDLAR